MMIEIIFDVICPWCYIGARRLSRLLMEKTSLPSPTLHWRPFILNPEIGPEGVPRGRYLEGKFGATSRIEKILSGQEKAGAIEGIHFNFSSISVAPNSTDAHRLICYAQHYGVASEFIFVLFRAYFEEALNIGDRLILLDIATNFGFPRHEVQFILEDPKTLSRILFENMTTHRMNITGIPCFIFNKKYAISGAQDLSILERMLGIALEGSLMDPMTPPK